MSNGTITLDDIIETNRAQARAFANLYISEAEDRRKRQLENWRKDITKPPRPAPTERYWKIVYTQEMPYYTKIDGAWIDFPEVIPDAPVFTVNVAWPMAGVPLVDGRETTVYSAYNVPPGTNAGAVLPFQGSNYKAVMVRSGFAGTIMLWERVG